MATREYTVWEDEFYRFIAAQDALNRSEGVNLRRESVSNRSMESMFAEQDAQEDFARKAFGAIDSKAARTKGMTIENIKLWQHRRESVAGGSSSGEGEEGTKAEGQAELSDRDTDSSEDSDSDSDSDSESESDSESSRSSESSEGD